MHSVSVHDLPQLYTKPPFSALQSTLLSLAPRSPNIRTSTSATLPDSGHERRTSPSPSPRPICISPEGIPRYLTSIISSSLSWLSEPQVTEIHELASHRLAERAGRTAIPDREQVFRIPLDDDKDDVKERGEDGGEREVELRLFEPSLTEDNLGLKTWGAGALLAAYLGKLRKHFLCPLIDDIDASRKTLRPVGHRALRILELGAGTGVVGLATAAVLHDVLEKRQRAKYGSIIDADACGENQKDCGRATIKIHMTDLPPIVPNLRKNMKANAEIVGGHYVEEGTRKIDDVHFAHGQDGTSNQSRIFLSASALDWSLSPPFSRFSIESSDGTSGATDMLREHLPQQDQNGTSFSDTLSSLPYDVILVADPLYSSDHPHWLTNTIAQNLLRCDNGNGCQARVISALPLRSHYADVRAVWARLMNEAGFIRLGSGLLKGREDWDDGDRDNAADCDADRSSNDEKFDDGNKEGCIIVEWAVWAWA
ncbi:MAG: hypothetical protein Q9160_003911 [Pyrenula sp. 1 TL-2023]